MGSVYVPEVLHLKLQRDKFKSNLFISSKSQTLLLWGWTLFICVANLDFLPTPFDFNNPYNEKLDNCCNPLKQVANLKNSVWPIYTIKILYSQLLIPLFLCVCVCIYLQGMAFHPILWFPFLQLDKIFLIFLVLN